MRSASIHGWIGGRYGSPTEYGLPLDDSYLFEAWDEDDDETPLLCLCAGNGAAGCDCTGRPGEPTAEELEDALFLEPDLDADADAGDDWTPVRAPHVQVEPPPAILAAAD